MSQNSNTAIAIVGIDIGKNSFHIVGLDQRGAIVLRQKWSRGQVEARFGNIPPLCVPKTQIRTYWWCSPPTSARDTMRPTR
jgi:hypothetical protein